MSTQSNAVNESTIASQAVAAAVISPWRRFYWSVRREIWENRSLYLAPAIMAAFVILGVLIAVTRGGMHMQVNVIENGVTTSMIPEQHPEMVQKGVGALLGLAMAAIMGVTMVVAAFYCMSTLQGERRDRSILFWKSLPVSDTTAVLGKAAIPFVVLPAVMMALVVVTQLVILLIVSAALAAHGHHVAAAWPQTGLVHGWGAALYHTIAIHVLWYAPLYCYMLMISAWSRRAPFLWTVVPPVVAGIVEKIAFNSAYIFSLLRDRLTGESLGAVGMGGSMSADAMTLPENMLHFITSSGLWIGLAVAVVLLVAAVRLRRWQGLS